MALFKKTTWKDRNVQFPRRYKDQNNNQYTFTVDEGTVTEAGTTANAARFNSADSGIFDAYYMSGMPPMEAITETLTYTGANITTVVETITSTGKKYRQIDLTYSSGNLSTSRTRIYDYTDGTTLLKDFTDTYTYSSGNLSSTVRTVDL